MTIERQAVGAQPLPYDGDMQPLSWRRDPAEGQGAPVAGHVIIGLGGVGRRTIAELRRTLDRPFGLAQPRTMAAHYLAIDLEDALEVSANVPSSLAPDKDGSMFCLDMASVREYATQLPVEVREWLSRYDAAVEIGSDTAANPRRLGSLLLAAKAQALQDWLSTHAADLLTDARSDAVLHVHVVGYFAGGIGGGALTQLLVQLRRNERMVGRSQIRVYGLLPSSDGFVADPEEPAAAVNTGALLSELASAQQRRPGRTENPESADLGFQRLCDEIMVISPPPETGRTVRDVRTLPEALAMAVRQRLFLGGGAVSPGAGVQPVVRQPIIAVAPKVLTTGGDEIEEALSLALLQSGLCQMVYAHWRPGRGFLPELREVDFAAYVGRSEVQERWLLTIEHLIQSAPVLDGEQGSTQWRGLGDEWRMVIERFMDAARGQPRKQWLNAVTRQWQHYFSDEFRGVGAPAYYRARQACRRDIARTVRMRVEHDLIEAWRGGEWGLADLLAMVEALVHAQRDRLASVDDRVSNTRMAEEACRVRAVAAFEQWSHLPFWTGAAKARAQMHAYCMHLHELYVNRTRAEGWLFSKSLLPVIIEELESLRQQIAGVLTMLRHGGHTVDLLLDGLSVRMEEDEDEAGFVVRLIDRDKLRQVVRDMMADETLQNSQARLLRQAMGQNSPHVDGFRGMAAWLDDGGWLSDLARRCRDPICDGAMAGAGALRMLTSMSIYDALQVRAGTDFGRLRDLCAQIVERAMSLLPDLAGKRLKTRIYILLPRDSGQELFIRTLKSAFSFSRRNDIRFVDTDDDGGRIQMLVVTAPFSVPDVELLRQMDCKYRDYVQCDREYAVMALHALGGQDDATPEDFVIEDDADQCRSAAARLLVGFPLRLVIERGVGDGGARSRLWLVPRDDHGFEDEPLILAEDLLTAPQLIYGALASLLNDNVMRALDRCARDGAADDLDRLINAVVEKVLEVRRRCNDDPTDPVYRSFVEAGKAAVAMIRSRWTGGEG